MNDPIFNHPRDTAKRQRLRKEGGAPEQRLWSVLRGQQMGIKFRRQHGIGRYIVDFYCPACHLVIEIDGDSHFTDEAKAYDATRNAYMQNLGLKVLRFTNTDVMQNLEGVYDAIKRAIDEC